MRENKGRQYISGISKTFFYVFSEFVYGGLCFFSLKPSPSQGESSLKISAHQDSPFRRSQGTNKQTHSPTQGHSSALIERLLFISRQPLDHNNTIKYSYAFNIYYHRIQNSNPFLPPSAALGFKIFLASTPFLFSLITLSR